MKVNMKVNMTRGIMKEMTKCDLDEGHGGGREGELEGGCEGDLDGDHDAGCDINQGRDHNVR